MAKQLITIAQALDTGDFVSSIKNNVWITRNKHNTGFTFEFDNTKIFIDDSGDVEDNHEIEIIYKQLNG